MPTNTLCVKQTETLKIGKVPSRHLPVQGQHKNVISGINVLHVNRSMPFESKTSKKITTVLLFSRTSPYLSHLSHLNFGNSLF